MDMTPGLATRQDSGCRGSGSEDRARGLSGKESEWGGAGAPEGREGSPVREQDEQDEGHDSLSHFKGTRSPH